MHWTHNGCAHTRLHIHTAKVTSMDFPLCGLFTEDICKTSSAPSSSPQPLKNKALMKGARPEQCKVLKLGAEGGQRSCGWLMEGQGVGWSKWQGISHIMASQVPFIASPGLPCSGHRATDPRLSINTTPPPPVDVLKLKNNYTATATFYLKVCRRKKREPVIKRIVCLSDFSC